MEKKGRRLRFRDDASETKFGTWEQVVEDAQKSLGEDPEIIRQVLTVAGIGDKDDNFDDYEVVRFEGSNQLTSDLRQSDGGIGEYGIAALAKSKLEKTVAVFRAVVTTWDDDTFPDDEHEYDDGLQGLYFILPEEKTEITQEDMELYKELAEQDNHIAQYLLGVEYSEGLLANTEDSQSQAQQWLDKSIRNGSSEARRVLNRMKGLDEGTYDFQEQTVSWQYNEGELLRQSADLDINDCLVEIKLLDGITKKTILASEKFSLDAQPVTFQVYKHNGKLGLVQNNEVQYFDTEAEFVAACLRMTGGNLKVMTVVLGLAFCGLTDYSDLFDHKEILGALGTRELDVFDKLSRLSTLVLSNGFAVSRRVAQGWQPGQTTPIFDEVHDLIAVVYDETYCTTLFKEDWDMIQSLIAEGNPNAILAAAQVYSEGDLGEQEWDKAEKQGQLALAMGCKSAEKFLEKLKKTRSYWGV